MLWIQEKLLVFTLIGALVWSVELTHHSSSELADYDALNEIGLTTAQLVRLRGYNAEDHYVTSDDGYILNLVKATNPLINGGRAGLANKSVVLFIHGVVTNANYFLVNSLGASPSDFSQYNASQLSQEELEKLLARESINSLPLLLMNFGHEVWLLNRRGTVYSLGRADGNNATGESLDDGPAMAKEIFRGGYEGILEAGTNGTQILTEIADTFAKLTQAASTAVNSDYWNFTLDQEAANDFPSVVDYVRGASGKQKISVLSHSAGGAVNLLAMVQKPELANSLGRCVMWAPSVNLGHILAEQIKYTLFRYFKNYVGPFPPLFSVPIIADLGAALCSNAINRRTICQLVLDVIAGPGGVHQKLLPGYLIEFLNEASSYQLAQLVQNIDTGGKQHYFQYGTEAENQRAYGSAQAPAYNFSKITLARITLLAGATDEMVAPADVESLREALSVPTTYKVVAGDDGLFNHLAHALNDNAGTVVTLYSLQQLELETD